jgi:uncharacterized protein YggU (UPF0235/DUF167 family)
MLLIYSSPGELVSFFLGEKAMPCEFDVFVTKKASHVRWTHDTKHNRLECSLTHEPMSEDANKELIHTIAEAVGVSLSKVVIVHGVHDYTKRVKISDHHITMDHVLQGLGLAPSSTAKD